MEDEFEFYAEDNLDAVPKNLHQPSGSWVTFEDELETQLSCTVEVHKDDTVTKFMKIQETATLSNIPNKTKIMIINHKKSDDSHELMEILRHLHELKLKETIIILKTNFASLNDEERDLLEVFDAYYDNFRLEFDDVSRDDVFKQLNYSDSEEEEENNRIKTKINIGSETSSETETTEAQNDGSILENMFQNVQELKDLQKEMKTLPFDDPRRKDAVLTIIKSLFPDIDDE